MKCHTNAKVKAAMDKGKASARGAADDTSPAATEGSSCSATNACKNFKASCILRKDGKETCAEYGGDLKNISVLEITCTSLEKDRGGPGTFSKSACSHVKAVGACQLSQAADVCTRLWFYAPVATAEAQQFCTMTNQLFVSP
jgi:hypothetical protein